MPYKGEVGVEWCYCGCVGLQVEAFVAMVSVRTRLGLRPKSNGRRGNMEPSIVVEAECDGVIRDRCGDYLFRRGDTGILEWRIVNRASMCRALVIWDADPVGEAREAPLVQLRIIGVKIAAQRLVIRA